MGFRLIVINSENLPSGWLGGVIRRTEHGNEQILRKKTNSNSFQDLLFGGHHVWLDHQTQCIKNNTNETTRVLDELCIELLKMVTFVSVLFVYGFERERIRVPKPMCVSEAQCRPSGVMQRTTHASKSLVTSGKRGCRSWARVHTLFTQHISNGDT